MAPDAIVIGPYSIPLKFAGDLNGERSVVNVASFPDILKPESDPLISITPFWPAELDIAEVINGTNLLSPLKQIYIFYLLSCSFLINSQLPQ